MNSCFFFLSKKEVTDILQISIRTLKVCYVFTRVFTGFVRNDKLSLLLKNVGQIRQSCIGCICFNFPHCVFSSVSSNYLPLGKQSHIGCISLTFPHCAFSYDPSKRLHKRKQSHIGCIFVTFLHCAFSNVSSNRLHLSLIHI